MTTNNTLDSNSHHVIWLVFLLLIEALYVLSELGFNAALLNVSGGIAAGKNAFENVEHAGRMLSGIGFSLFVFGLICSRVKIKGLSSKLVSLIICTAVCAPAMYYGQKIFIDHFLIDQTTAEDRLSAKYMALLKRGLSTGSIEIGGVPQKALNSGNPEDLTFLSVIGSMLWNDNNFSSSLKKNQEKIIGKLAERESADRLDDGYAAFSELRSEVRVSWSKYNRASNDYHHAINKETAGLDQDWSKLQSNLSLKWKEYENARRDFYQEGRHKAEKHNIYRKLTNLFNSYRRCKNNQCYSRNQRNFDRFHQRYFKKNINKVSWCYKVERSASERILSGFLSLGLTELVDNPSYVHLCPGHKGYDRSHMHFTATKQYEDQFRKKSGGYSLSIENEEAFRNHSITIRKVKQRLANNGVKLPDHWNGEYDSFIKAGVKTIKERANKSWKVNITNITGSYILPGKSYGQFLKDEHVKSVLSNTLGALYFSGLNIDGNKKYFYEEVLYPSVVRETQELHHSLMKDYQELGNGGIDEEEGKTYVRVLILPPIALFLSLFFSFVSIAKMPVKIMAISWHLKPKKWKLRLKNILFVFGILSLLGFPALKGENKYSESNTVIRILESLKEDVGDILHLSLSWLLKTEPMLFPVGQSLLEVSHLDNRSSYLARQEASEIRKSKRQKIYTLQEVQQALIKKGYLKGKDDGLMGPVTRSAIVSFQRDHQLKPDGALSPSLYEKLF